MSKMMFFNDHGSVKNKLPSIISIDLTNKCNHRCNFCIFHQNDNAGEEISDYNDMSNKIFEKILPLVKTADEIQLEGGGEPTISFDFMNRVKLLKETNPKVKISLVTNGSMLSNYSFCKDVVKYINSISFSLHGLKSREKTMIGSSNKLIKKSLVNLSNLKRIYNNPTVNLYFILMRDNLSEMVQAKLLAKQLGFDSIRYSDLWITSKSIENQSIWSDPSLKKKFFKLVNDAEKIDFPQHTYPNDIKDGSKRILRAKSYGSDKLKLKCMAPFNKLKIKVNGDVRLCACGFTPIGSLRENTVEEIWNSDEANKYREGMITGKYYKYCAICPFTQGSRKSLRPTKEQDTAERSFKKVIHAGQ